MWFNMFELADEYVKSGMTAYVNSLQEKSLRLSIVATFSSHQQEVGAGYFDDVTTVIQGAAPQLLL